MSRHGAGCQLSGSSSSEFSAQRRPRGTRMGDVFGKAFPVVGILDRENLPQGESVCVELPFPLHGLVSAQWGPSPEVKVLN